MPIDSRTIEGFPDYRVTTDGDVISPKPGRPEVRLKPGSNKNGYLYVFLWKDGKSQKRYVHHLVLEAFVGPCPPGMECCHGPDHDPRNNRLDNIRWATHQNNIKDKVSAGRQARGSSHALSVLSEADVMEAATLLKGGMIQREVAVRFRVSTSAIKKIAGGRRWSWLTGIQPRS